MKIAIIGTAGIPGKYGGFETLAENLVNNSAASFITYCSKNIYKQRRHQWKNSRLVYLPFNANGPSSIVYDGISIFHAIFSGYRNLLILGTSGAIFIPLVKLFFHKTKIVTNIDGLEWKRDKHSKLAKFILKLFEKLACKFSSKIIADNISIKEYIDKEYKINSTFLAYGGRIVKSEKIIIGNYYLAICRVEPENNCNLILEAFAKSSKKLKFVGNWDSSTYGKELKERYSSLKNIEILDPIYEHSVIHKLRSECLGYVHGHSAGGTNPSLVEIMHYAKNIYAFDCVFNRNTLNQLGSFFSNSEELLNEIERNPSKDYGKDLSEFAELNYNWKNISEKYINLFK